MAQTARDLHGDLNAALGDGHWIERHPWITVGVATVAGVLAARLFMGGKHEAPVRPKTEDGIGSRVMTVMGEMLETILGNAVMSAVAPSGPATADGESANQPAGQNL